MPKKGSRLITVDTTTFRWRVGHKPTTNSRGENGNPLSFVAEQAENPAGTLKVSLPCARPDNTTGERTTALRPALVAACIQKALDQGWTPNTDLTLTITEDDLTALLGERPQYLIPFLWGMIPEGGTIRDLPRATQIWPRNQSQQPAPREFTE